MKKLIIAAAIVCAAACVQASAVTWKASFGGFFQDDWTTPVAGTIAVLYGGNEKASGALSAGEWTSDIAGDTTTNMKAGEQWTVRLTTTFDKAGAYYYDALVTMPSLSGDPTLDGQKWIALNGEVNDAINAMGYGIIPIQSATKADLEAAGWTAAAVPEPTSGLLLLLGVAGLALRRRRA